MARRSNIPVDGSFRMVTRFMAGKLQPMEPPQEEISEISHGGNDENLIVPTRRSLRIFMNTEQIKYEGVCSDDDLLRGWMPPKRTSKRKSKASELDEQTTCAKKSKAADDIEFIEIIDDGPPPLSPQLPIATLMEIKKDEIDKYQKLRTEQAAQVLTIRRVEVKHQNQEPTSSKRVNNQKKKQNKKKGTNKRKRKTKKKKPKSSEHEESSEGEDLGTLIPWAFPTQKITNQSSEASQIQREIDKSPVKILPKDYGKLEDEYLKSLESEREDCEDPISNTHCYETILTTVRNSLCNPSVLTPENEKLFRKVLYQLTKDGAEWRESPMETLDGFVQTDPEEKKQTRDQEVQVQETETEKVDQETQYDSTVVVDQESQTIPKDFCHVDKDIQTDCTEVILLDEYVQTVSKPLEEHATQTYSTAIRLVDKATEYDAITLVEQANQYDRVDLVEQDTQTDCQQEDEQSQTDITVEIDADVRVVPKIVCIDQGLQTEVDRLTQTTQTDPPIEKKKPIPPVLVESSTQTNPIAIRQGAMLSTQTESVSTEQAVQECRRTPETGSQIVVDQRVQNGSYRNEQNQNGNCFEFGGTLDYVNFDLIYDAFNQDQNIQQNANFNIGGGTLDFLEFDTQAIENSTNSNLILNRAQSDQSVCEDPPNISKASSNLVVSVAVSKTGDTSKLEHVPVEKEDVNGGRPSNKFLPQDVSFDFESGRFTQSLQELTDISNSNNKKTAEKQKGAENARNGGVPDILSQEGTQPKQVESDRSPGHEEICSQDVIESTPEKQSNSEQSIMDSTARLATVLFDYKTPQRSRKQIQNHNTRNGETSNRSEILIRSQTPKILPSSINSETSNSSQTANILNTSAKPPITTDRQSSPSSKSFHVSEPYGRGCRIATSTPKAIVNKRKKPCITISRLRTEQIGVVEDLRIKGLVSYSRTMDSDVTHLVVNVDKSNSIKFQTLKYLQAIAAGIWILGFDWVSHSLRSNRLMPEEDYEVRSDIGGDSPRRSRLDKDGPRILSDYKIYIPHKFQLISKEDAGEWIKLLGGTVVDNLKSMENRTCKEICLIVAEDRSPGAINIYERWIRTYGIITVDIEWLMKTINEYNLASLRPHLLIDEESLSDKVVMYYPKKLINESQVSSTSGSESTLH